MDTGEIFQCFSTKSPAPVAGLTARPRTVTHTLYQVCADGARPWCNSYRFENSAPSCWWLGYLSLIIVYVSVTLPVSVWILRGFLIKLPISLEEAAAVDGAAPLRIFWDIVLPLARPGIIATAVYVLIVTWQEFLFALSFTSTREMRTLPVGLNDFIGQYGMRYGELMASSVMVSLPILAVFYFLQRYFVAGLKRGAGAVINISSVQSLLGFTGWAACSASKGGIDALTRQTAVDLAPYCIRVNAVAPGTIMTPMNEKIFDDLDDPSALIGTWNRAHPLGRFGEAHEVAETVAYLASDRASFITGEIVRVDGGLAIRGE